MGSKSRARAHIVLAAVGALSGVAFAQTPPPLGYSIKSIGLTGPGYQYNFGFGYVQGANGFPLGRPYVTSTGAVAGNTSRYDASGSSLGRDAWFFNGTTTSVIGLTAAPYSYAAAGGTYRDSSSSHMNDAGQVVGFNQRLSSGGAALGFDMWRFSGGSTQAINPTGAGYEYTDGAGTHRYSDRAVIDSAGNVVGAARRYAADGSDLGNEVWRFNGTSTSAVGLLGAGYEYSAPGGTYRRVDADLNESDPAGRVAGTSDRYATDGTNLGTDAWRFDGTTTQQINLTGGVYEYSDAGQINRQGFIGLMGSGGHVYGSSYRFESNGDDLGTDTWLYNGTTTTAIGLTGGDYEYGPVNSRYRYSEGVRINAAGQVLGNSSRFASNGDDLGRDMWVHNGTTTNLAGLTGADYEYNSGGVYRYSESFTISSSGGAVGTTSRFASDGTDIGADTWVYNGSTSQRVGLIGAGYEHTDASGTHRNSNPSRLNASGKVNGDSVRFSAAGDDLGRDSWYYDGTTSKRVNPVGGIYEYTDAAGTHRLSSSGEMNSTGQLVGVTNRYTVTGEFRGQAGWFYDPFTDLTSLLEFSISSTGYSETSPEFLTDSGVVLGVYDHHAIDNTLTERLFWWSDDSGFHDLGEMVSGGLSAAGWQYLADMYTSDGIVAGGSPKYILGTGLANGEQQTFSFSGLTPPQTAFLLTAQLPEPASLALLTLPLLALGRRRRA